KVQSAGQADGAEIVEEVAEIDMAVPVTIPCAVTVAFEMKGGGHAITKGSHLHERHVKGPSVEGNDSSAQVPVPRMAVLRQSLPELALNFLVAKMGLVETG